jgi:PDZ domain-containing secreted protein
LGLALAAAVLVGSLAMTASSTYAIEPGSTAKVDPAITGLPSPAIEHGGLFLVDVRIVQLSNLAALVDRLVGRATTEAASELGIGTGGLAHYAAVDRASMAEAERAAVVAARRALARRFHRQLPPGAQLDVAGVRGPSAGLAGALGLVDRVLGGQLSRGRAVVATGTIDASGQVGLVGGVAEKATAVAQSGATIFLVPAAEVGAARGLAGRAAVIPVRSLDGAISALLARR